MNNLTRLVYTLTLFGIISFTSVGTYAEEEGWKSELQEDMVKIKEGKMSSLQFGLLSFPWAPEKNKKIQVRLYAEAPSRGVISRDKFVSITTQVQTTFFVGLAMRAKNIDRPKGGEVNPKSFFTFNPLEEPIGNVDVTVNIYMGKEGLQIEFLGPMGDKSERRTITWAEILE